ncbi:MAG: hypothetical protein LBE31_08695, partial [Deltaproteobacteria bacterium]|nr:hypothetical protein [Deltaproteobacteria bacterium]
MGSLIDELLIKFQEEGEKKIAATRAEGEKKIAATRAEAEKKMAAARAETIAETRAENIAKFALKSRDNGHKPSVICKILDISEEKLEAIFKNATK